MIRLRSAAANLSAGPALTAGKEAAFLLLESAEEECCFICMEPGNLVKPCDDRRCCEMRRFLIENDEFFPNSSMVFPA